MDTSYQIIEGKVCITLKLDNNFNVVETTLIIQHSNVDAKLLDNIFKYVSGKAIQKFVAVAIPIYVRRLVDANYVDILLIIDRIRRYNNMLNAWSYNSQKNATLAK